MVALACVVPRCTCQLLLGVMGRRNGRRMRRPVPINSLPHCQFRRHSCCSRLLRSPAPALACPSRQACGKHFSRTDASCTLFELQLVQHLFQPPAADPPEEPLAQPATASDLQSGADSQPSPAPVSAGQLHGPRLQAALASLDPFDSEDVLLHAARPPYCKP